MIDEYNLPFSVVAPFNPHNPELAKVDPFVIGMSSKAGTLAMLLNAGLFHNCLAKLYFDRARPAFGSSANISLTGSKFKVEDFEFELIEVANIVIDHGHRNIRTRKVSQAVLSIFEILQ